MMSILLDNSLYLAVPRTGSQWMHRALCSYASGKLILSYKGHKRHMRADEASERFRFMPRWCVVRHPIDWLWSFWCYRQRRGWRKDFELDVLKSDYFPDFIDRYLSHFSGFISELFHRFTDRADWVGCYENGLAANAAAALNRFGDLFNPALFDFGSRTVNVGASGRCDQYGTGQRDAVIASEYWVVSTWYS